MAKTVALVGEKLGMTQVWDESNQIVPVTVLRVSPARVVQIRTPEKDGYSALQVTYGHKDARKLNKPLAGHYAKGNVDPGVRLVELRLDRIEPALQPKDAEGHQQIGESRQQQQEQGDQAGPFRQAGDGEP